MNSKLVASAHKWDLDYLEQNMGNGDYTVYVSRNHKFKYYDDKKIDKNGRVDDTDFVEPTKRVNMKLFEFVKRIRDWKKGDER